MDRVDRSALATAAAILVFQLFLPPVVGLANNGDWGRLIGEYNLGTPPGEVFQFAATKLVFDDAFHWESGFYSSERIFAILGLAVSVLVWGPATVDIRGVGLV